MKKKNNNSKTKQRTREWMYTYHSLIKLYIGTYNTYTSATRGKKTVVLL